MELVSKCDDDTTVVITLKFVQEINTFSNGFLQVMNTIARKCLRFMGLTQLGRGYFDPQSKVFKMTFLKLIIDYFIILIKVILVNIIYAEDWKNINCL